MVLMFRSQWHIAASVACPWESELTLGMLQQAFLEGYLRLAVVTFYGERSRIESRGGYRFYSRTFYIIEIFITMVFCLFCVLAEVLSLTKISFGIK